jgi:hypothetical protein
VQQELAEVSRAVILSNLTDLVDGLEVIKKDLQEIHITTKSLQNSSNNLASSKLQECKSILLPSSSGTSVMSDARWLICWHREKIVPFLFCSPSFVHHIPVPFVPSSSLY